MLHHSNTFQAHLPMAYCRLQRARAAKHSASRTTNRTWKCATPPKRCMAAIREPTRFAVHALPKTTALAWDTKWLPTITYSSRSTTTRATLLNTHGYRSEEHTSEL